MLPRHVVLLVATAFSAALVAGACTGRAGGGAPDPLRGDKYYKAKCNSCHPGGGQGAGPGLVGKPLPGPLKKVASGGRHNVPPGEWDSLMLYLTPIMNPGAAAAAAAAPAPAPAPAPVAAPVAAPAPAPAPVATPAPAPAPAAPAMKTCNCTCQCPVGTPPGQMQNCTCSCACPPG